MPNPGLRYAPGLDGVRALAVAAVVAYHLGTTGDGAHPLRGGFLGVDVFFVLSGYLITGLLVAEARQTGRISIRQFYLRRARRLLPALFALLLAVGAIGAIWLPQQAARLRGDLVAALAYGTNWWLIVQKSSYFGGGDRPPLLTHLWSLAVEEQFYLVWPLVLIVFAKLRAHRRSIVTVLLIGVAASSVAAALLYSPWKDPSRVYYGTDTRALAPLLGAALAIWLRPWRRPGRPPAATGAATARSAAPATSTATVTRVGLGLDLAGVAALAGLGAIAVLLGDTDPRLYRGGFTVIALLAAVLVAAAGHPDARLGRVLGTRPLRWLGERSYAIYLWHWPVCVLTRPGVDVPLTGWANAAARIALAVVLADLSYRFVERPIRRGGLLAGYRSRHAFRPPRLRLPAIRLAAFAALISVSATTVGFQLSAAAGRPVQDVPVDAGPAPDLGALDGAGGDPAGSAAPPGAVAVLGPRPSASPTGPAVPTVAVFGDSQGMTLLVNRPADLGRYLNVTDATIEGCGFLVDRVASRSGERRDLGATCADWNARWAASAQRLRPRIALVMIGAWDVFDLTTPEGTLTFGTPQWDARFSAALARGITALRAAGAKVALSLLPCYRPVRKSAGFWPERGDDPRTRHVNALLRAAVSPGTVFAIEPPAQFCTDPAIAADLKYRWDGVHYFRPGAALYFRAVIPQLLKI